MWSSVKPEVKQSKTHKFRNNSFKNEFTIKVILNENYTKVKKDNLKNLVQSHWIHMPKKVAKIYVIKHV